MNKLLLAALMSSAFFAAAAPTAPAAKPHAAPAPHGQKAAGTVSYSRGEGYFVKNTHPIPANGISCLWLDGQANFDQVFQKTPPLMNSKRTAPLSLVDAVAFAVIYQGTTVPEMKMTSVTVKDGAVVVAYTLTQPKSEGTATFAVPLIIVVDKAAIDKAGGAKIVRFIENGKEIGTAQAK